MARVATWDDRLDKLSEFELERVSFYTGERYSLLTEAGEYKCGRCDNLLYKSGDKCQLEEPLNDFPSFSKPATPQAVTTKQVWSFGMGKTQLVCGSCQLHLGYSFADGSSERQCVLSLSLNFVPSDPSAAESIPDFDTEPKAVLDHLAEQDQIAGDILRSGNLVQIQEPTPEPKETKKSSPKKTTPPPKKSTPSPTKAEPTKSAQSSAGTKATTTRGAPSMTIREEGKSMKKQQKEETTRISVPRAVVAPIVLSLVTSVIIYFAFKSTQKE